MEIRIDDLKGEEIHALLNEHLEDMKKNSPPESIHALDIEGLQKPEITFWAVWEGKDLLGCGAIKELNSSHGEIKSMRTSSNHRRKGAAKFMLEHILAEAVGRGYERLSLETGSMHFFKPAQTLYAKYGFEYCDPFGDYNEDPNSVFMTRELVKEAEKSA